MRLFLPLILLLLFPLIISAQAFTGQETRKKNVQVLEYLPFSKQGNWEVLKRLKPTQNLLLSDASLVLSQATLCPDWEELEDLSSHGLKAWIDTQIQLSPTFISDKVSKWNTILREVRGSNTEQVFLAFQLGKWQNILTAKDQFRQRMAWLLDEFIQKEGRLSSLELSEREQARYYDLLIKHALGNYQNLLSGLADDPSLRPILKKIGINGTESQQLQKQVNQLFHHSHTGPQLAHALIEGFGMTRPSQRFITRVAEVFEDNGNGVRGDLGAMIPAIFSDPETHQITDRNSQFDRALLLEPMLKYQPFCKTLDTISPEKISAYLNEENKLLEEENAFYSSPEGFNFFLPADESLEFLDKNLLDMSNSLLVLSFIKEVENWAIENENLYEVNGLEEGILPLENIEASDGLDELFELAARPEELLDYLDLLFVQGLLSDNRKMMIAQAISELKDEEDRLLTALYLIFISPDYRYLP